jgi:HSP20 family protein
MSREFLSPMSMFDDLFDGMMRPMRSFEGALSNFSVDIKEKDNEYALTMNVPGFKKEDVNIDIKDNILKISSQTDIEKEDKDEDGKYVVRERRSSSFSRQFKPPDNVDKENIKAKMEDGVLTLTMPKTDKVEQKNTITIE